MSNNVQVVEIGEENFLVPNLTISVDNEEGEADLPEVDYEMTEEAKELKNTTVTRQLNSFPRKKLYQNKYLRNAATLGLSFEEAEARRKKRSERFQSPLIKHNREEIKETPEELLQKSQLDTEKIAKFNESLSLDDDNFIRHEALHLMGVDSMSTDDIFAYFGSTHPRHIEWVNDSTCNVVWGEAAGARIALERIALPHHSSNDQDVALLFDDDLDLDGETGEQIQVDKPLPDAPVNPVRVCREKFVKNKVSLSVRFATVGDRKEKFAAKKSKYYLEHGNPHYGGTRGLLSSSYRRRYQMKRAMREYKDMKPRSEGGKRARLEDDVKREKDEGNAAMEIEDETLLRSTVKDFEHDTDSDDSDVTKYGTMMADQVSLRVKAARDMSARVGSVGGLSVTTSNNKVFARLGSRRDRHAEPSRSRNSTLARVQERLRQDTSVLRREKSARRELKRYSPPPWE